MSEEMDQISSDKDFPTIISDDNQLFSAEYRDGQLQIVEVAMYDKLGNPRPVSIDEPNHILPDVSSDSDGEHKYLQVLETSKGMVQLDLLNFALVKGSDGNTYQMVSTDSSTADNGDTTITCVLSSDDVEDGDKESYVMLQTDDDEEQDPYIYLQTAQQEQSTTDITLTEEPPTAPTRNLPDSPKALTPTQILEKAKALQKAKALLSSSSTVSKSRRGRKRKSDLPPPMELLSSPNFKLYLYSCKQCTFKCNATKEMTVHKKSCHKVSTKRPPPLQCARCPYKGHTHAQLMKHIRDSHAKTALKSKSSLDIQLDSEEVEAADVLVCGACGFESGDRPVFREHIVSEHGARSAIV